MAKEKQTTQAATREPGAGKIVNVEFDAGGLGINVYSNPVNPGRIDDKRVRITWSLNTRNLDEHFEAYFGNVVLADTEDVAFVAQNGIHAKGPEEVKPTEWSWTYEPASPQQPMLIEYEIFVVTQLKQGNGPAAAGSGAEEFRALCQRKTLSVRQTVGLDPTLLTPPGG